MKCVTSAPRSSQSFIAKWDPVLTTGLFLTTASLLGSTRVIEWFKAPATREGLLLTSLLHGALTASGSMLAKKYHLDCLHYKGIIETSSIALGSFAAHSIVQISLEAALTIGAINLILRLTTYSLYKLHHYVTEMQEIKASFEALQKKHASFQNDILFWKAQTLRDQIAFNKDFKKNNLTLIPYTAFSQKSTLGEEDFLLVEETNREDRSEAYICFLYKNHRARARDYTSKELDENILLPMNQKDVAGLSKEQIKWHHYRASLSDKPLFSEEARTCLLNRFSEDNLKIPLNFQEPKPAATAPPVEPPKPINQVVAKAPPLPVLPKPILSTGQKKPTLSDREAYLKKYYSWDTFPSQPGQVSVHAHVQKLRTALRDLTKDDIEFLSKCEGFYRIIEHKQYRAAASDLSAENLKILAEQTLYIDGFDSGIRAIIDTLGPKTTSDFEEKVKVLAQTGHPGLSDLCLAAKVKLCKDPASIMTRYNQLRVAVEAKRKTVKPEHYNKGKYEGKHHDAPGDVHIPPPPVQRLSKHNWTTKEIVYFVGKIQKSGPSYKDSYFRLAETMGNGSIAAFAKYLKGNTLNKYYSLEKQMIFARTSLQYRQERLQIVFRNFSEEQIEASTKLSEFWEVMGNLENEFVNPGIEEFSAKQFTSIIENMILTYDVLGYFNAFVKKIKVPEYEEDRAPIREKVQSISKTFTSPSHKERLKEAMFKHSPYVSFERLQKDLQTSIERKEKNLKLPGRKSVD